MNDDSTSFWLSLLKNPDLSRVWPLSPVPVLSCLTVLLHQLFHVTATNGTQVMEAILHVFQPLEKFLSPLEQLAKAVGISVHNGWEYWVFIHLIDALVWKR